MQQSIVHIEHLSHRYSTSWAIRDIDLDIRHTGIFGLLGSNGAGKSTIMNILCGVLRPTEGKVLIDGIDLQQHPAEAKTRLGFLPQNPPLYLDLTVDEYLTHCAFLRLMPKKTVPAALRLVEERCGIAHFGKRLLRNLSGGYRQRVGIAQAIIHQPALVVLDEPTNGLDPNQVIEVRNLIREIAAERAVIFSSHVLSEVQLLCKEIRMIEAGRIVFADSMDAFNNYIEPHSVLIHLDNPPPADVFMTMPGAARVEFLNERQVRLYFHGDPDITTHLIETGVHDGWQIREISLDKSSLDEIFAQLSNKPKSMTR
jgi:ABC-2 type transport system ATP-binding protein